MAAETWFLSLCRSNSHSTPRRVTPTRIAHFTLSRTRGALNSGAFGGAFSRGRGVSRRRREQSSEKQMQEQTQRYVRYTP